MSCKHINVPKKSYSARSLGRFGNQLFDYIFMRLLAIQYGSSFKNNIDFPSPFDVPKGTMKFPKETNIGMNKFHECIPDYPMSIKYFNENVPLIKSFFNEFNVQKKYDIVIHIRLDDVFDPDETEYSVMPLSYFNDAINHIFKYKEYKEYKGYKSHKSLKIAVVSRPINDFQKGVLGNIVSFIECKTNSKVHVQSGSITEDILTIMSSDVVIGSVGSFWVWPALLSPVVKKIILPTFGHNHRYEIKNKIKFDNKVILPIKIKNMNKKIDEYDSHRIYDTTNKCNKNKPNKRILKSRKK